MPESATPNLGLVMPTPGSDTGTWGTTLNTAGEVIDEHDHSSGKGVRVTQAGINITGDLEFNGNAATELKAIVLAEQEVGTGLNSSLRRKSDGELYWRTTGGTDVKLTSGSGLNTTLVGGITGDYSSTNADVDYSSAGGSYRFWTDNTTVPETWAKIETEEHKIYPSGNGANSVNLKAPAGLAADYDITFPAALPGSNAVRQVTSAGVETFATSPSITGLTITDAAVKHGELSRVLNLAVTQDNSIFKVASGTILLANGEEVWIGLPVHVGERIKSIAARANISNIVTDEVLTLEIVRADDGALTVVETSTLALSGWRATGVTGASLPHTVTADRGYYLRLSFVSSNAETVSIGNAAVTVDRT